MGKHITIATIGTVGDVLPYIALANELDKRGYNTTICAPLNYKELVENNGVKFFSLGSDIKSFVTQSSFDKAVRKNNIANLPALLLQGQKIVTNAAIKFWDIAQKSDALIVNFNTSFGIDMAEALDIPVFVSAFQPLNKTNEFPICAYSGPDFGQAFNRLSYTGTDLMQAYYNFPRNKLRKKLLNLAPRKGGGFAKDAKGNYLTTLYAYSKYISPKPKDWPKTAIITGFWRVKDNSNWKPSKEFQEFLDSGSKPIYVGFGSMPFGAEQNTKTLKEAAKKWGGRIVIASGWGGFKPENLPKNIFAIEKAPHDKLFKYMAGVIHHGGAGTTAAGLYAACPTFVLPQTVDQPFWGRRVYSLGCGPKPVPLKKLTPEILASGFDDLCNNLSYKENAKNLAQKLNAENGPKEAIKYIENIIENYVKRSS